LIRRNTPCAPQSSIRVEGVGHRIYYKYGAAFDETTGNLPLPDDNDESRAIIKALSKLKDQKVNLAQAFAEREQLVKLFYDTANTIVHGIEAFRKRNPKYLWDYISRNEGKGRRGGSIPQKWLELQYGWNPLMADITGSADKIAQQSGQKFRASVKATVGRHDRTEWYKWSDFGPGLIITGESKVETKVRLDYVLENPILATLAQVGITNPISLAWELFPYSFVVDWFTDVGGWISSMDAALGWDFKGGTKTVYQRLDEAATGWTRPFNDGYQIYSGYGAPSYSDHSMQMSRTVYLSSPLPRFPGLKNPMSSGHIANALALLATSFR